MRHAVLGVGGVGGLLAALLARVGEDVTLVIRPEIIDSYPDKLRLTSPFGDQETALPCAVSVMHDVDFLWICVKATQLDGSLRRVAPSARVGTAIPLLNGVDHIATLERRFGPEVVLPATIEVESERQAPGVIVHRSPFAKLNLPERARARMQTLEAKLNTTGFECKYWENQTLMLWSKLVFLAPMALTTAASGLDVGGVLAAPFWRDKLAGCVEEACRAAQSCGAEIDSAKILNFLTKRIPPTLRTSMQKDVHAGREPEIDAIAGPIIRASEAHGMSSLTTRELAALVQRSTLENM